MVANSITSVVAYSIIIHNKIEEYLNNNTQTLEHFRFPYFIRPTKKAYISILNGKIIEIAEHTEKKVLTYNSLKWIFKQYDVPIRMSFCRKIFATFLRTQGVQQEIIDLLEGVIPRNVFVRHYYRPNFAEESNRVSKLLPKLYEEIRSLDANKQSQLEG
jgi:intergrase/recombinase